MFAASPSYRLRSAGKEGDCDHGICRGRQIGSRDQRCGVAFDQSYDAIRVASTTFRAVALPSSALCRAPGNSECT